AIALGTAPDGTSVQSPESKVVIKLPLVASLMIDKSGHWNDENGNGVAEAGETVTYSFLVRNDGRVPVNDVTVSDRMVRVDQAPQSLAPGATFIFTGNYLLDQHDIDAGEIRNRAKAVGRAPDGRPVESPEDEEIVP